jgi:hypothetical protein
MNPEQERQNRPRPDVTPNGIPHRTELPFEFEICAYLDSVDRIPCNHFEFTFWTEHRESIWMTTYPNRKDNVWHLSNGHVLSNVEYVTHEFGRTWMEYLMGYPLRQRVQVFCKLLSAKRDVEQ